MNQNILIVRIETSRLLTDAEKKYWCGNLDRMNAEQIAKLERILSEAEGLPWTQEMEMYLQIATKATVAVTA